MGEKMSFQQDVRHLIYLDTQFGWRGETDLKLPEMQSLEARGWISESDDNGEYVITKKGERIIELALTQPAQAVDVGEALTAGQRAVATELLRCCESWERGVRVMGNVQAGDAADLLRSLLAASSDDVTATDFATAMRDCGISLHMYARVDQRARQLAKERAAALPNANGKEG